MQVIARLTERVLGDRLTEMSEMVLRQLRFFVNLLIFLLMSLMLITPNAGEERNGNTSAFPSEFILSYLEYRSLRRAVIFTNIENSVFKFGLMDAKKLIGDASKRFINLNVLPLEQPKNSTPLGVQKSFYSTLNAIPSPLIIFIYDNSTAAVYHLKKASVMNHFRASYKWLVLTDTGFYEYLNAVLLDVDASVDSDVTVGVARSDGNIELQDVYVLGRTLHMALVGNWQVNNLTCLESKSVCMNNTMDSHGMFVFVEQPLKLFQRSNFNGFQLKIVTVNVSAFYTIVTLDSSTKMLRISGGYLGELMNVLIEAMNFTYTVNLLDGYAYGVILSTSAGAPIWSGVVGELQNRRADVSGCEVSFLLERQFVIDYSTPLQIISRRLYIHRPTRSGVGAAASKSEATWYKGGGFVRPFELQVWFCVTASILLFLGAARLHAFYTFPHRKNDQLNDIEKIVVPKKNKEKASQQEENLNEPVGPPTLSSDFFRFMATLVQQGVPDDPDPDESKGEVDSSQSRRLILWTASVTYLIIYTSYGAKLASILASESEPQPPFTDLEGLLDTSNWKLGFLEKGLARVSFENAKPDSVFGRLWTEKVKDDPDALVTDGVTGLRKVLAGEYAYLGVHTSVQSLLVQSLRRKESEKLIFTVSEVCRIQALPHEYLTGGIGFGFQEGSPLKQVFDNWILVIRSCGLLDRMAKTWLPETLPCLEEPFVATVGITDIAPALSALAFGVGLSAVVLMLELAYNIYSIQANRSSNHVPFYQ